MIQIQNVSKIYKTKERIVTGVDNVSLDINTGEIFGIVGYSGAGKSSLIRCLNLLEKPTERNDFSRWIKFDEVTGE